MAARLFSGVFISTEQLKGVLGRVQLLDVRYSLVAPLTHGAEQHAKHRPVGSIFIDVEKHLCGATHGTTARHPLPEASTFGATMASLGVGAAPCVCFDDTAGGLAAGRCWWMLDNLGIEAYMLDGGWQAYAAAGLPVETDSPSVAAPALAAWPGRTAWSGTVTHADLAGAPRLLDARTADRYGSTVRGLALDPLAGHVPGAVNRPWVQNVEPVPGAPAGTNRLKPVPVLKAEMEAALGGVRAEDAVFMCASGVTTCMNLAVTRHVGLGAGRIYPGSWSEYCGLRRSEVLAAQMAATHRAVAMRKPIMAAPLVDAACKFTVDAVEYPSLEAAAAAVPGFEDVLPLLKRGEEAELFTESKGIDAPAHVVVAHA
jgi:thiosulfate/3-mercaptopyruvate sulfurtransferase